MTAPATTIPQQNFKLNKWFVIFCLALLSIYPIYRNFYYSSANLTYERHMAIMEQRSDFYNPWQYRVLIPFINEGLYWVYNHTVDKVFPIEEKIHFDFERTSGTVAQTDDFLTLMQTPGAIKYMLIFILMRWTLNFIILYLAWKLWRHFIKSDWLAFFGINFLALAMGNAVAIADLAFNTYADIVFYLLTALIIIEKRNRNWLIPISILASFNRETGMLIPALYFISQVDFSNFSLRNISLKKIGWPQWNTWLFTGLLYILFMAVFVYLRWYYGYRPQTDWKVPAGWPMLKLNLASAVAVKGYMELIGTFGILPFIILYKFKQFPYLLKKWFLFLAPIWFLVHFISVPSYQTRLFLVPIVLIFIPMVLWFIEQHIFSIIKNEKNTNTSLNQTA